LAEPGAAAVTFVPKMTEAQRRELNHAKAVIEGKIGIEPPAQAAVELFGAIDVRNTNDNDLKLHGERSHVRRSDCNHHGCLPDAGELIPPAA
jgi:hypothetical protein